MTPGVKAALRGPLPFVVAAVALRVAWVLTVPSKPVGDFAMYLESAAHVVEHGRLDDEFVYMPGYVFLLALVQACGGGWLAAKLVGAVLGGLAAWPVFVLAEASWDRASARIAAGAVAVWPAGVAVSSVTGTDMPAAVFVACAFATLVSLAKRGPMRAAAAFGALMGLAAWIRAVSVPLAAFAFFVLLTLRVPWRRALAGGVLAVTVAFAVLFPWAIRNRVRYGEWVFTDSHGGLTALVGANPNTDGRYTRSLNRMFEEVTGMRWLAEPHRVADKTAYALAVGFTKENPAYATALLATKADRLLGRERSLLYWPLFRAGVLREPQASVWAARRTAFEQLADGYWAALVALSLAGLGVAVVRKRHLPLVLAGAGLAMAAVYVAFFAEARYHLAIAVLMFPAAGGALVTLARTAALLVRTPRVWPHRRGTLAFVLVPSVVIGGFQAAVARGEAARDHHRFAVHVARVAGRAAFVSWHRGPRVPAALPSPVVGVYDGVGLVVPSDGLPAGASLEAIARPVLPPGRYRVRARVEARGPAGMLSFGVVGGEPLVQAPLADVAATAASAFAAEGVVEHPGGPLAFVLRLDAGDADVRAGAVWLSALAIEAP